MSTAQHGSAVALVGVECLEEIRRSVRAEVVRYEAPGTALIPIRHVRRRQTD